MGRTERLKALSDQADIVAREAMQLKDMVSSLDQPEDAPAPPGDTQQAAGRADPPPREPPGHRG